MKKYQEYSDGQLATLLKEGKVAAFDELYRRYSGKLLGFARTFFVEGADAEEVVQEIFIQLWEKRKKIKSDQNIESFLFTCVKNRVFNQLRARKKEVRLEENAADALVDESYVEESSFFESRKAAVFQILGHLPPTQKEIFTLSKLEGYSHQEIADMMDVSIRTVEHHIYLAKKQLKSQVLKKVPFIILLFSIFL
ncbi:RNA polymerase sigma factor [Algoriphagus vanfongensis]|uniref:RNA polymerase sigma factor n=1 Tax=Algoriphagus vanfongensis TaxID=426371 RepID=UPI000426E4C8|nr:RNA polymerase sigma-70 factor [Algoriphagus vanfongensis]